MWWVHDCIVKMEESMSSRGPEVLSYHRIEEQLGIPRSCSGVIEASLYTTCNG